MKPIHSFVSLVFFTICLIAARDVAVAADSKSEPVKTANLIYAGSKSSVCFSEKFLDTVERETNIEPDKKFIATKLGKDEIFDFPFAIMTGEGSFTLQEEERVNLKSYLTRGGFLLASAGCSSRDWDRSFRKEIQKLFPDVKLVKLEISHPIHHTVFDISSIKLKNGGSTSLEGLEIDGRIVLIYSPEGLNDTPNVKGCCCCGGNEVRNCQEINVNIFTYALTH